MSYRICEREDCTKLALIRVGDCQTCGLHLCGPHIADKDHPCHALDPTKSAWAQYLTCCKDEDETVSHIDRNKLAAEAAALRPGNHTCTAPPGNLGDHRETPLVRGGMNFHLPLTFEDGVKWMVRIRKNRMVCPKRELVGLDVVSEVATIKAMKEADVTVPDAWERPENAYTRNIDYFFEEFVDGQQIDELYTAKDVVPSAETLDAIRDLALWFISLEKLSFSQVGSLTLSATGDFEVGPAIDRILPSYDPPHYLGPFANAKAYYLAVIDAIIQQTVDGVRFPPSTMKEATYIFTELRIVVENCKEMEEGPNYIVHGEPRGDHLRFGKKNELVGIIDWQWARVTCKAEAFAAPWGFLCGAKFWGKSSNELSIRERALANAYQQLGRPDLEACVLGSKKYHRLNELLISANPDRDMLHSAQRAFRDEL